MPIPSRIDKISNGHKSVLVRPLEPVEFKISNDIVAIIKPLNFIQQGLNTSIQICEVKSLQLVHKPIEIENIWKWW